jgi:hypothetical protein
MATPKSSSGRPLIAVLPALAIAVAWFGGYAAAPEQANRAYFESCAQVIPVLLLALAVESRWLRLSNVITAPPPFKAIAEAAAEGSIGRFVAEVVFFQFDLWWRVNLALMLVLPIAVLSIAEWACLVEVARLAEDGEAQANIVSGGVVAGLAGVAVVALVGAGLKEQAVT